MRVRHRNINEIPTTSNFLIIEKHLLKKKREDGARINIKKQDIINNESSNNCTDNVLL